MCSTASRQSDRLFFFCTRAHRGYPFFEIPLHIANDGRKSSNTDMTQHVAERRQKRNRIYVKNAKHISLDLRYPHLGDAAHKGSRARHYAIWRCVINFRLRYRFEGREVCW
jgi:hypothetical protein